MRERYKTSMLQLEQRSASFPLYAMRMRDFLALEELLPHNELRRRGLVVALDTCSGGAGGNGGPATSLLEQGAYVNFVSHQWLAYQTADPEGAHLRTMQQCFAHVVARHSVFHSAEDAGAFLRGCSDTNAEQQFGSAQRSEESFRASVADGWVWMDFISIPQTIGLQDAGELATALEEQVRKSLNHCANWPS